MVVLLTQVLSGCTQVTITDDTLYFPIGHDGGALVEHSLDTNQQVLSPTDWDLVLDSTPLIAMNVTTYGNLKKIYETFCSDLPQRCTWQIQQQVGAMAKRLDFMVKWQRAERIKKLGRP